ncbi:MAG: FHA domain-containing protein [Betaproteobacteria bacterium]|nr:MAG: FHA domain-containing protein [Betaproteobacteria bacterium]
MSKLVLFLPDGTTLDIPLTRERTTIGRRADNDICLPHLAVSGEHAVVVTILADSFLEDLQSTNGTLVNDKPVAKHFLRDGDEIEIGRNKLVYCADDDAQLGSKVATGMAFVKKKKGGPTASPAAAAAPAATAVIRDDLIAEPVPVDKKEVVAAPPVPPAPPPTPQGPSLRLLTGLKAGTLIALTKSETTLGRPGVQVASIVQEDASFRIKPVEGISPPSLNGQPVGSDGAVLAPGDIIEVAGTRVEYLDPGVAAAKQDATA